MMSINCCWYSSNIGRAEGFASRNPVGVSALDGFMMGLGFLIVLTLLGLMREVIGFGTILAQADLMFGEAASALRITLSSDYQGFLLASANELGDSIRS